MPASTPADSRQLFRRLQDTQQKVNGESWFVIRPDLYAIPYLDGYLLYSPLQGLVFLITRAGLASLLLSDQGTVSECLGKCVVESDSDALKLLDSQSKFYPKAESVDPRTFRPTSLTLSPTSVCQLACTYCYIRGGDNPRNMPWEIAESAIRLTVKNAASEGLTQYDLGFHGQGEPTANWKLLRRSVLMAEELCASYGIRPQFSVVTNGILNNSQISFFAEHAIPISLSMDSATSSMDRQRPMRNGGSSLKRVIRSIRTFEEKSLSYSIRSTVTPLNVTEMSDFVGFVKAQTQCTYVHFEPVFQVGRACDRKIGDMDVMVPFIKNFHQARDEGIRQGIKVTFSTCRLDGLRTSFCGAYGANLNFCVSTEGLVSSCFEVLEESDPRADIFVYGRYDGATQKFEFNETRLSSLLNLNVTKMARCRDCYVKYNCGGDCLAKAGLQGVSRLTDNRPLERCIASRTTNRDELVRSLFMQRTL